MWGPATAAGRRQRWCAGHGATTVHGRAGKLYQLIRHSGMLIRNSVSPPVEEVIVAISSNVSSATTPVLPLAVEEH